MSQEQPQEQPEKQPDLRPQERTQPCDRAFLCRTLFWTFLKVGAFTFGGGYAMIPLIRQELCANVRLMGDDDFVDALAVVQCSPGAVAINTAVFVGQKLAGTPGALAAAAGAALPSFVILLAIAMVLGRVTQVQLLERIFTGVRPAVVALIASAALKLSRSAIKSRLDLVVAAIGLIALSVLHAHPAVVIIGAILAGLALSGTAWLVARRTRDGIS
ncbi:MAG: chromate transporter [Bacillota bacterium]|nr:chromate transporter [Bacillota bacterium]